MVTVDVSGPGLSGIRKALAQAKRDLRGPELTAGAVEAADPFRDAARRAAPVLSGATRNSVRVTSNSQTGRSRVVAGGTAPRWVYVPIVNYVRPGARWLERSGDSAVRPATTRIRRWLTQLSLRIERLGRRG